MSKIPTLSGGVNLWGESPMYVNPVNVLNILTKILAEDKSQIPIYREWCGVEELEAPLYPIGCWFMLRV